MIFNIQHFHKVCKAFLGNLDMLETFLANHAIKKNFISLMTTHRGHLFEFADLKKEDKKRNSIFLLIFDKDSLIAISRLAVKKQIPEINMVHVNALYRGQKWCQKMIYGKQVIFIPRLSCIQIKPTWPPLRVMKNAGLKL